MPDRVTVRREEIEETRILRLALPRVGDVGVVRHQDHHPATRIDDRAQVDVLAVGAALRRLAA